MDEQERRAFMDVLADVASRARSRRPHRRHVARRLLRSSPRLRRVRQRPAGSNRRPRRDDGDRAGRRDPPPAAAVGVEVDAALVARITGEAAAATGRAPARATCDGGALRTAPVRTRSTSATSTDPVGSAMPSGGGRRRYSASSTSHSVTTPAGCSCASSTSARTTTTPVAGFAERSSSRRDCRGDELDALLRAFGRHRLLTFDRDAVEPHADGRGGPRGTARPLAATAGPGSTTPAMTC